jgi:hypothetical protein
VNHYKKAIHLRNLYNDVFEKGTYSVLANDATKVASFSIDYEGATYYLVHNADSKSASLPLSGTILGEIPCKEQFSTLGNGTLSLAPLTSVFVKK